MDLRLLRSAVIGPCGLEAQDLVEISGSVESGKSLVLQQLIAHCLAPYKFGGREWSVLLINLSHKISRESLTKSLKAELRANSEVGTEGPEDSPHKEQLLAEIAGECLRRVRFFNCFCTEDVNMALVDSRFAVLQNPSVQLVALDTLSEFYWLDFAQRTEKLSRFRHYRLWQARLERLCREAIVCGMYTVDSAFLEDKYGEPLPRVQVNHHFKMQKIRGRIAVNGQPVDFV
ncbi:uncharacterized protein LOC108091542 [Drosophila ficusphila]|uniref:uncharacterized protein LOC108091542 n=1 Tax=Drosophila ficusphila TaxID=30025 RepID=UPI0007E658CC|nr:uncharacterized protein LOC108091542 [Drosophila ficusphila]